MSINRIDFQGAFARTSDIGAMKASEDARPQADQNAFQIQFEKEKERDLKSVQASDETQEEQPKFDAREKGSNEYQRRKKQEDKDKEKDRADDGGVIDMHGRPVGKKIYGSSFDFKI